MKVGLNLFSVRNLIAEEADFLNTAEKLKEIGYAYFQYSGAAFDADRIARVTERTGVPVLLTHVPIERIVNDTERLMEEHSRFGCGNIGLGAMPLDIIADEKACKDKIEELNRAGEIMSENGFKFFYHHHFFEFFKHGGKTVFDYMIENAPYINFTVDTYWLQYGGADVISFMKKLKGRMDCVHLKDYRIECYRENGETKMRPAFAPLGDGIMNFKEIVSEMRMLGVRNYFVEQDDAALRPDTLEQIERSAKYAEKEL